MCLSKHAGQYRVKFKERFVSTKGALLKNPVSENSSQTRHSLLISIVSVDMAFVKMTRPSAMLQSRSKHGENGKESGSRLLRVTPRPPGQRPCSLFINVIVRL